MDDLSLKAAYLEDWMDTIEALPGELQRNFSLIRELDALSQGLVRKIETSCQSLVSTGKEMSADERKDLMRRMTAEFNDALKHAESKVTLAVQTYDMVDKHIRHLDEDLLKFEDELTITGPKVSSRLPLAGARKSANAADSPLKKRKSAKETIQKSNSGRNDSQSNASGSRPRKRELSITKRTGNKEVKRRGSNSMDEDVKKRPEGEVDPNEPTYCICNQVSYGAMIACDNEDCDIEWFHYECVGLDSPPKGKWYCASCQKKLGLV